MLDGGVFFCCFLANLFFRGFKLHSRLRQREHTHERTHALTHARLGIIRFRFGNTRSTDSGTHRQVECPLLPLTDTR